MYELMVLSRGLFKPYGVQPLFADAPRSRHCHVNKQNAKKRADCDGVAMAQRQPGLDRPRSSEGTCMTSLTKHHQAE